MDFGDLLKAAEPIFKRSRSKPLSLQRVRDLDFETRWQTAEIERDGHSVVHVTDTKRGERVVVYRRLYGDGMDDEDIMLGARVFSVNGVKSRDPQMLLIYDPESGHMTIADVRVDNEDVSRGYGSALMAGMFEVNRSFSTPVKYVSGWISAVDWDHIERSVGFYSKHGFKCELNHEARCGSILWVNPDADGSTGEFNRSIESGPGF